MIFGASSAAAMAERSGVALQQLHASISPPTMRAYLAAQMKGNREMAKVAKVKDEVKEQETIKEQKVMTQSVAVGHKAEVENIHAAAQEDAGFEKILKFKKGKYFIGEDEIPLGTKYLAHTTAWTKCWIKFLDGEVADRKMYRVALGEKPPVREDLDERNEDEWPNGLDGEPADPWVYQYLLPLENLETGEVAIFVSSSYGGKRAVSDLCDAYAKNTKKTGCGQPIIKLKTTDMPTKKFGKVPRPLFEVDHWDEAGGVEVMPPTTSPPDDMNDAIPF
jgi:hypothetical protein